MTITDTRVYCLSCAEHGLVNILYEHVGPNVLIDLRGKEWVFPVEPLRVVCSKGHKFFPGTNLDKTTGKP